MTDYNKQTVANLRQVLKDRGIPSTGLTRKAQIVDKLVEWDNRGGDTPASAESESEPTSQPVEAVEKQLDAAKPETDAPDQVKADENAPQDTTDPPVVPAVSEAPRAPEIEPTETTPAVLEPPATAIAVENETPSPAPDEKQSIENPDLTPILERSTTSTAELSRLNTEELEADTRKRKRRSLTPDITSGDPRAKKPRPSEDGALVTYEKDEDTVMVQKEPEEEKELDQKDMDSATNGHARSDVKEAEAQEITAPKEERQSTPEPEKRSAPEKKEKDARYRSLFETGTEHSHQDQEALTDDRPMVPALHSATPAIYIRNFMRPLRPEPLRAHLVSLASPPSSSPDSTIVKSLFLDNMKTHALVLLANTTAASRVRASLHGSIWPPEKNRNELWVDFIPEDKIEVWIREEEDAVTAEKESRMAGRPIPAKKFEVVYPEDDNGDIKAVFQEVGASALSFNPPRGPRRPSQQLPIPPTLTKPAPTVEARQDIEKSFKTLDELFLSTTAKPKLYYLPVSDDRSEMRLKELDLETSRYWTPDERRKGRGIQGSRLDQKVRFSFDYEDRVIEAGGDFGPWSEDSRGGRGGFRGGRGGRGSRGGGGWRSGPSVF